MPTSATPNNALGDTIKTLLRLRGLKAYELGEQIEVSATSISKIMNGASRPRQNTFTRMCQVLCKTKEEEQKLVAAYAGSEQLDEEPEARSPEAEKEILRLRAEQFLERKTQSIQFKRSVARELNKAGIPYSLDYCEGIYSTDFLIEKNGKRIALECKSNIGRDTEKVICVSELLIQKINCDVIVVLPYVHDIKELSNHSKVKVASLSELTKHFQ